MPDFDHTAEEAAKFYNVTVSTVFEDLKRIRQPDSIKKTGEWGGGNNHLMSSEEEEQFLNEYLDPAKEVYIISMPELHAEYKTGWQRHAEVYILPLVKTT